MIDTDKYENMRQLFLDLIDSASDEIDEEAWKNKLTMLDELLAEVKRLREEKVRFHWIQEARGGQSKAFELLAEVKRYREVLAEIKGTIDEYIHDVWDGNIEGWQCASDNIAALGIKSEWEEEE